MNVFQAFFIIIFFLMERVLLFCERGPFSLYPGAIFSSFHVHRRALPLPWAEPCPAWWMLLQLNAVSSAVGR